MGSSNKDFYIHIGIPDKETINEMIKKMTLSVDFGLPFFLWIASIDIFKPLIFNIEFYKCFLCIVVCLNIWAILLVRYHERFKNAYFLYVAVCGEFISLSFLYIPYYTFKEKVPIIIYVIFIVWIMSFFIIRGVPTKKGDIKIISL